MPIKALGWRPPTTKPMHPKFDTKFAPMAGLPPKVDLRALCPAVYDQLDIGSCTANASAAMAVYLCKKLKLWTFPPSRLALYYWTRLSEGTVNEDSGCSMQESVHTMTTYGVPNEALWWYNPAKFMVKPSKAVEQDARKHLVSQVYELPKGEQELKTSLYLGFPFVFGFFVRSSFDRIGSDGLMPIPTVSEPIYGGHAVMAVGYDDERRVYIIRNSWGAGWGDKGYFYMPYAVMHGDDAMDYWTAQNITLV